MTWTSGRGAAFHQSRAVRTSSWRGTSRQCRASTRWLWGVTSTCATGFMPARPGPRAMPPIPANRDMTLSCAVSALFSVFGSVIGGLLVLLEAGAAGAWRGLGGGGVGGCGGGLDLALDRFGHAVEYLGVGGMPWSGEGVVV